MNNRRFRMLLLLASFLLSVALFVFGDQFSRSTSDQLVAFWISLWILWPFTIFAAIVYPMRERPFRAWLFFSIPWVLLTVALISREPAAVSGGWGVSDVSQAFSSYILMNGLYVFVSAFILIVLSFKRSR